MHFRLILFLTLCVHLAIAVDQPPGSPAPQKRPAPPQVILPEGVKVERNVPYVTGGGYRRQLDIYYPEKADKALPLVVWIHGGGWREGSKEGCPAVYLTTNGFVVASINYRFSQQAKFPAQIQDCKAAIRWLRAHAEKYHIDPKAVGAWGASAGGHLVALLGSTGDKKDWDVGENLEFPSAVQAVCDSCGPTDFVNFHKNPSVIQPNTNSPIFQLLGGQIADVPDKARAASPVTYISKNSAPLFIVHGDADRIVPLEQSQLLVAAAKKAGVESTLYIGKGGAHVFEFGTRETLPLTLEFFRKHLQATGDRVSK